MTEQPNKPGGDLKDDKPRRPADEQAVKNQGGTTPEKYPEPANGRQL